MKKSTKDARERTIFGERCVCTDVAAELFFCERSHLSYLIKEGMPCYSVQGKKFFPVERCRAWFRGEDVKVEEIPHVASEVVCLKCLRRWIAVRPAITTLKELECPDCGLQGYAIETGEEIIEEEA